MAAAVRPIRTKRDHEAALKEVARLWGAKTGTSDGDRLDVLATLIDACLSRDIAYSENVNIVTADGAPPVDR
jgi:antitoxin component HigA of HigAB toxin-antitoxin module